MKNKERLYIKISKSIALLINNGEFPVGSRLPTERELSEIFNVSRPTIREAIIALEVKEIVSIKAGSGVYVVGNTLKIEDFSVLCSNCHRMVHRKNPPYSIEEVKKKLKK